MNTEITERELQEFRLRKQIAELEKQVDVAWTIVYKKYTGTAEYREYNELRRRMWELQKEIDNL